MKLIDFHTHPLLKPANSSLTDSERKNLWHEFPVPETYAQLSKTIQKAVKSTDKTSQTNLGKVTQGSVNGIFFAMGPAERPFFKPNVRNILVRCFLPKKDYKKLARSVTGFAMSKIDKIFERIDNKKGVDYFNEELQPEFQYLLMQEKIQNVPNKFKIAKNYSEFKNIIDNDPSTIAVILTIEGAHAFGNFQTESDFVVPFAQVQSFSEEKIKQFAFIENIRVMKSQWGDRSPLFVTLCHHFWNLLSGHSKSMSPSKNLFKPGMDAIIDQFANMNVPMTKIGEQVVDELLSKKNGRRILIDVKHMSVSSRKWYYNYVKQKKQTGDNIPIICSHTSINLFTTMEEASAVPDTFSKDENAYLSRFSINLSNDEILAIADSKGIIGIILNEGRMPGELGRKAIQDCEGNPDMLRDIYVKLIMCNIIHIVRTINKKEAWDLICIGSDFDGVIDPFEIYQNALTLGDLPTHLMQYISNPHFDLDWIGVTANDIKTKYMFDYSAQEIGEKFASRNIMLFLDRYFQDSYLKSGSNIGDNIIL